MDDQQLLTELRRFIRSDLPSLLDGDTSSWQTLDVDYESPRVERIWFPHKDYRVNLHRIHPCESALYHPHPWPSAILIISGVYESVVGSENVRAVTQRLVAGDSYAMSNPLAWHSVRPLYHRAYSVMLTWAPFDPPVYDHGDFGKKVQLGPLTNEVKLDLLSTIGHLLAATIRRPQVWKTHERLPPHDR